MVCKEVFASEDTLRNHSRTHTGKWPRWCGVCGKGCRDKCQLKLHVNRHGSMIDESVKEDDESDPDPSQCDRCQQWFKNSLCLTDHKKTHENEPKKKVDSFPCEICGKNLKTSTSHTTHMYSHTGAWPFKCNVCGHGCFHKNQLNLHKKVHEPHRKIICRYTRNGCRYRFENNKGVGQHENKCKYRLSFKENGKEVIEIKDDDE